MSRDTRYHLQGRSPTTWRIANSITMSVTRSSSPSMVSRCWGCQERHDSYSHWKEQSFIHTEKRQNKISFHSVCGSHLASGSFPETLKAERWSALTPFALQTKDPIPSPPGTGIAMRLTGCRMTHMLRRTEKYTSWLE